MRNYRYIDQYISQLEADIYPQPQDAGHTGWAREVFDRWSDKWKGLSNVLDVGCGEAFMQPWFETIGVRYTGVCRFDDYTNSLKQGRTVLDQDFHFLPFTENSFDLIFSRHSLEHSPMPLIALMEWHRISRNYLCLVLPKPEFFGVTSQNHYSVMPDVQASFLLARAGWHIAEKEIMEHELQYLCVKDHK